MSILHIHFHDDAAFEAKVVRGKGGKFAPKGAGGAGAAAKAEAKPKAPKKTAKPKAEAAPKAEVKPKAEKRAKAPSATTTKKAAAPKIEAKAEAPKALPPIPKGASLESYGRNKVRAQARANQLNIEGNGWIVDEVEGSYVVRHDGSPHQPKKPLAYPEKTHKPELHEVRMVGGSTKKWEVLENGDPIKKDGSIESRTFRSKAAAEKFAAGRIKTAKRFGEGEQPAEKKAKASAPKKEAKPKAEKAPSKSEMARTVLAAMLGTLDLPAADDVRIKRISGGVSKEKLQERYKSAQKILEIGAIASKSGGRVSPEQRKEYEKAYNYLTFESAGIQKPSGW